MMKKLSTLLFMTILLSACSSEAALEQEKVTENLFNKNCAGCHGLYLTGTELGGPILGFSKKEVLEAIENGKEGMVPNILIGEDAERVAKWVSKRK